MTKDQLKITCIASVYLNPVLSNHPSNESPSASSIVLSQLYVKKTLKQLKGGPLIRSPYQSHTPVLPLPLDHFLAVLGYRCQLIVVLKAC